MKQAIFLIVTHGCDGRAPESIVYATLDERVRDQHHENSLNKNYNSTKDVVIDLKELKGKIEKGFNGLELLALGQPQKIPTQKVTRG